MLPFLGSPKFLGELSSVLSSEDSVAYFARNCLDEMSHLAESQIYNRR